MSISESDFARVRPLIGERRPEAVMNDVLPEAYLEPYTVVWALYDTKMRFSATVWSTSPVGAAEAVRVRHDSGGPGAMIEIIGVVELRTVT